MTGWNLPPGCTSADIDRAMGMDATCDVCGCPADSCICPECPVCQVAGRIECYAVVENEDKVDHHKLLMTREQVVSRTRARIAQLQDQIVDLGQSIEYLNGLPDGDQLRGICGAEVLDMRRTGGIGN